MARGENERTTGNPMGAAILGIFTAFALAALAFVVVTTRACANCDSFFYGGMVVNDPYVGASTAASELGWRDAARARMVYGAPLPSDAAGATSAIDALLLERGYVSAATLPVAVAREMPATFPVPELGGACGLVEIVAEPGARIDGGAAGGLIVSAADPSALTIGTCGDGEVSVQGIGRFTARAWLMPGLVPGDVATTGLSADLLLAHAEAERVLGRYGYVATNDAISVPFAATGILTLPTPSSGCVPWVVASSDAGMATSGAFVDRAPDRTLALAITCATRVGWDVTVGGTGGTAIVRAYRPPGSGAALPGDTPTSAAALRIVEASTLAIPPGIPEAPP